MKNVFIVLGTGTLCISQWLQSSYFSDTISALTERDWVGETMLLWFTPTLIVRN